MERRPLPRPESVALVGVVGQGVEDDAHDPGRLLAKHRVAVEVVLVEDHLERKKSR